MNMFHFPPHTEVFACVYMKFILPFTDQKIDHGQG